MKLTRRPILSCELAILLSLKDGGGKSSCLGRSDCVVGEESQGCANVRHEDDLAGCVA